MKELTRDASTLATCMFAGGLTSVVFTHAGSITVRALAAIHNLVECGYLIPINQFEIPKGAVGWRCTPQAKRFLGRQAPPPEHDFPFITEGQQTCH